MAENENSTHESYAEVSVSFGCRTIEWSVEEISEVIGLDPTSYARLGEKGKFANGIYTESRRGIINIATVWTFDTKHFVTSLALIDHLVFFKKVIAPRTERIQALKGRECHLSTAISLDRSNDISFSFGVPAEDLLLFQRISDELMMYILLPTEDGAPSTL